MITMPKSDITSCAQAEPLAHYVRDDAGDLDVEFVDVRDPAAALEAKEASEQEILRPTPAAAREDVLEALLGYLMADDPHPAHVLRRLWLAIDELAPHLKAGVLFREAALLTDASEIGHAWRVKLLVRGTRKANRGPSMHDAIVRRVMAAAYARRKGFVLSRQITLDTIARLQPGESVPQFGARQAATVALLQFLYVASHASGTRDLPRPEAVLRQVYLVAKSLTPHLILHMSLQNLGDMFGQERATWSHRGKHKLAAFLAARGAAGFLAPHMKSQQACATYAAAQRGNRNRLGLPRRHCA
jgi:hypothetical protein